MELNDAKESLDAYAQDGRPLGGFLTAILENNLFGTYRRADSSSLLIIPKIMDYVYNEITSACWGSPEKVTKWLEDKRKEREANVKAE